MLGRGGMGEVYRARDTRLRREVAIKVLPAALARYPDRIARFEREARAASALNHPNIVGVYDIGHDNGTHWIATELVTGESLASILERGPLAPRKAIEIATQIADGLAAAHTAGIVHRDLKPGNVMIARDGRVKILDFGLAKQRHGAADSTTLDLTQEGTVMGTAGYMSPEQVRGQDVDPRSDIFSLGVVLYEMAGGKRAFEGGSSEETMSAILRDDPPELPRPVPPALDRIVRRCLEKAPGRRFQSAADLALALGAISLSPARAEPRKKKRWARWAALAAAFAGVSGATLFWLGRPLPPPRVTGAVQITNDGRQKTWGPLLTDGLRLFFNSEGPVHWEVNHVSVKGGETVALSIAVKYPWLVDISPDRTEGLVCANTTSQAACELWAVPLLGGSARRLGNLLVQLQGSAWSPDGQQLVYTRDGELHIARSDGTELRKLATLPGVPYWVRWSPDGSILRLSVSTDTETSLWEVSIHDGSMRRLLPGWNPSWYTCCGNWTPDGKYFVFQSGSNIWALREKTGFLQRASREPVQLTTGPMSAAWPVPSPDGKRLFIKGEQPRNEFLRYDLLSRRFVPELAGVSGDGLEFSRDGKWVVYVSVPEGSLFRAAADGSQRLQLAAPALGASMPHWSPDGKQIAFMGAPTAEKSWRIYVVSFDGGPIRQVSNGESGKSGDLDPSWSPDGASLAFGVNNFTANNGNPAVKGSIHVVDLKGRQAWALPGSEGMWSPRWSPDGRFIAGLSGSGLNKLLLYELQTRKQTLLFDQASGCPSWSWDGEFLFFESDSWVWRVRIRDRKLERIANLDGIRVAGWGWFAAAPNNSFVTARDAGTEEIYALDWEAP